jgi:hypothetical protein
LPTVIVIDPVVPLRVVPVIVVVPDATPVTVATSPLEEPQADTDTEATPEFELVHVMYAPIQEAVGVASFAVSVSLPPTASCEFPFWTETVGYVTPAMVNARASRASGAFAAGAVAVSPQAESTAATATVRSEMAGGR